MKKSEVSKFINEMEEVGDVWTEEEVMEVYADFTLEEALADRKRSIKHLFDIIDRVLTA
jgi:uncharacterized protein Yka (UPF0111/DUF47 family)